MNCPTCGDVEHIEEPFDEAHCECENGWDIDGGVRCKCPCHDENCDGFSPTCQGPRADYQARCGSWEIHGAHTMHGGFCVGNKSGRIVETR